MECETLNNLQKIPVFVNCQDQLFDFCTVLNKYQITRKSIKTANGIANIATYILPAKKLEKLDKYVGSKVSYIALKYPIINKPTKLIYDHSLLYCNALYRNSMRKSWNFSLDVVIRIKTAANSRIVLLRNALRKLKNANQNAVQILRHNSKTSIIVEIFLSGYYSIEDITIYGYNLNLVKNMPEKILQAIFGFNLMSKLLKLLTIFEYWVNRIDFDQKPRVKYNNENKTNNDNLISEESVELYAITNSNKRYSYDKCTDLHANKAYEGDYTEFMAILDNDDKFINRMSKLEKKCRNVDVDEVRQLLSNNIQQNSDIITKVPNDLQTPCNSQYCSKIQIPIVTSSKHVLSLENTPSIPIVINKQLITVLKSEDNTENHTSNDDKINSHKEEITKIQDCNIDKILHIEGEQIHLLSDVSNSIASVKECNKSIIKEKCDNINIEKVPYSIFLQSTNCDEKSLIEEDESKITLKCETNMNSKDLNKKSQQDCKIEIVDCDSNQQTEEIKTKLLRTDNINDQLSEVHFPKGLSENNILSPQNDNKVIELNFDNICLKGTKLDYINTSSLKSNKENNPKDAIKNSVKKRSHSCEVRKCIPVNYSHLPTTPQTHFVVPKLKTSSHYSALKKDSSELFPSQECADKNKKKTRKHRKNTK